MFFYPYLYYKESGVCNVKRHILVSVYINTCISVVTRSTFPSNCKTSIKDTSSTMGKNESVKSYNLQNSDSLVMYSITEKKSNKDLNHT